MSVVEILNPGDGRPWRLRLVDDQGVPVVERFVPPSLACCLTGGGEIAVRVDSPG